MVAAMAIARVREWTVATSLVEKYWIVVSKIRRRAILTVVSLP